MADDYSRITPNTDANTNVDVPHTIEHPTQSNPWQGDNFNVDNVNQRPGRTAPHTGSGVPKGSPNIGDLQRKYDFGNTYTNLSYQRDPFIHLLTKFKKKPTSDFKFEYAVKRASNTFKRYGYVLEIGSAWGDSGLQTLLGSGKLDYDDNTLGALNGLSELLVVGDYKTAGNIGNKVGVESTSNQHIVAGSPLTQPNWFLTNQVIKIPLTATRNSGVVNDYAMAKIMEVKPVSITNTSEVAQGTLLLVKIIKGGGGIPNSLKGDTNAGNAKLPDVTLGIGASSLAQKLEPMRTYIAGTAYHELSGYGETWKEQPFSTDYGYTQIFKNTALMSGRAMATGLKFGESPWANEWANKMTEMTYEIGQAGYFGEQYVDDDGVTYTEGIVNFILNNGNQFKWSTSTTLDDYFEQMSALHDPRYAYSNGKAGHVYYCSTEVYNWMAKLGGFMKNNAELSPNYSVQFSGTGKMAGVKYRQFEVDGHTMKLVKDIHLDGTNVKMICADMNQCAIRPLSGNGVNRDVAVYPGVKTVANSGEDYRVDLIQGDIGFEFSAPESHAVWLQG
jgi:hypothetical protein